MTANTITRADGWEYVLTADDKLWAARMVAGESGDALAVLWTMASRLALARDAFESFGALLRAYSQPINPRWQRNGEYCRPGGRGHGTDACGNESLARRQRVASLRRGDLGRELEVVERWARGEMRNPVPRAVHFAAPRVAQACLRDGSCARVVARVGNWHLSTDTTDRWPTHFVRVGGAGDSVATARAGATAVGLVAVAGLAWWAVSRSAGGAANGHQDRDRR